MMTLLKHSPSSLLRRWPSFCLWSILILVATLNSAQAQTVMRVPEVAALSGSYTHLYVLSSEEGLAVFRATPDSISWIFTSDALINRGNVLVSDARFGYLFGSGRRLTVIDPTMPQALYSATTLPSQPLGVARLGSVLFLAMGREGIGSLSLAAPDAVDESFSKLSGDMGANESILGVAPGTNRVFALGSTGTIYPFIISSGNPVQDAPVATGLPVTSIHGSGNAFLLSTDAGDLYSWMRGELPRPLGNVEEPVSDAYAWNEGWLVRTDAGQVWLAHAEGDSAITVKLRDNRSAGNYITVNKATAWISEFGRISTLSAASIPAPTSGGSERAGEVRIAALPDLSLPYPQPVLASFSLADGSQQRINWFARHHRTGAVRVRGNAMIWQPSTSDIGTNEFTVIATNSIGQSDSTTFRVNVRQFNAPPQLIPIRPVSIPVDEEYRLQLSGMDPDGTDSELVRFSGVNLPDGVRLDSQTGLLRWTPTDKQLGRHVLQIITSDQYGASMSNEIILNVIRLRR